MKLLKFNPHKSKAQAMVEFAIVLPILLLVVYGLIETGRLIFIYASVNNATRQAVRYGSTSGVGPNGVPRYQDCDGIRAAAQQGDYLNVIDNADITIEYDRPTSANSNPGPYDTCTGSVDANVNSITGDRVNVSVNAGFTAIIPKFLPFLSRTLTSESSRTLLLTINIVPPKEPTTTLITADTPDPSVVGEYVLVTVVVSAPTTPTGDVYVTGADQNCTITLSGGTGSCSVRFVTSGPKTITASYNGDADHDISSDTEAHTVNKAPTVTTITADTPDPSLANQAVNVTVTVTSTWPNPTGTVDISGPGTSCTVTLAGGTGNCNLTFTTNGTKSITATYNGAAEHAGSTDTELHNVILPTESITTITAHSPDPSNIGQSVTVSVTVAGITLPTGTVDITGADTNCSFTLTNGTGSCVVTFNSAGGKTLTATYSGDATHTGSSGSVGHTVALPPTITTITANTPNPSSAGQSVNVTVSVTGGATPPTGTVTISGADTNCTITLSGGVGNCNVVFNSVGVKTLTATYSGASTHAPSSGTKTHTVEVTGCNTVTVGLLQQTGGALTMTINNPLTVPLQIGDVTLQWNHDKGHQTGDDKTLRLQFVNLNGIVFWSGNNSGPIITPPIIPNPAVSIPPGASTITFTFHQTFDRWDNTEMVMINLSTPGCNTSLIQTNH